MSTKAVTKISKRYPYDHLLDWTKVSCPCQTEGIQDNICIFIAFTDETSIFVEAST